MSRITPPIARGHRDRPALFRRAQNARHAAQLRTDHPVEDDPGAAAGGHENRSRAAQDEGGTVETLRAGKEHG